MPPFYSSAPQNPEIQLLEVWDVWSLEIMVANDQTSKIMAPFQDQPFLKMSSNCCFTSGDSLPKPMMRARLRLAMVNYLESPEVGFYVVNRLPNCSFVHWFLQILVLTFFKPMPKPRRAARTCNVCTLERTRYYRDAWGQSFVATGVAQNFHECEHAWGVI